MHLAVTSAKTRNAGGLDLAVGIGLVKQQHVAFYKAMTRLGKRADYFLNLHRLTKRRLCAAYFN
jgi:hypothetical protein